jgi:probable F420-dependent oxidoreductase
MQLGRLGVWSWMDMFSAADAGAFAARIEEWGYAALWIPEAVGRDPIALHAHLAGTTSELILATGIANIYARDAMTMRAGRDTLAEMSNGRFLLGLGVSHAPMVSGLRGHDYGKPVTTMRAYLEAMEKAIYLGPAPPEPPPVVIAALRPKMLGLAAEATSGAHPYNVTPEHTARAREILGKKAWLCPEQKVMLETDASKAREVARTSFGPYVSLPNYQNNLKWLGFEDSDFENGGSDRLLDALFAWGDETPIRERIQAHWDAGADHVAVQTIRADGEAGPDMHLLELLAPNNS